MQISRHLQHGTASSCARWKRERGIKKKLNFNTFSNKKLVSLGSQLLFISFCFALVQKSFFQCLCNMLGFRHSKVNEAGS